jgi:hypothetical protein
MEARIEARIAILCTPKCSTHASGNTGRHCIERKRLDAAKIGQYPVSLLWNHPMNISLITMGKHRARLGWKKSGRSCIQGSLNLMI